MYAALVDSRTSFSYAALLPPAYMAFINMGQYFKLKIYALGRAKYSAATVKHPTLAVIRDRKINERMPVHYRLSQSPTFG